MPSKTAWKKIQHFPTAGIVRTGEVEKRPDAFEQEKIRRILEEIRTGEREKKAQGVSVEYLAQKLGYVSRGYRRFNVVTRRKVLQGAWDKMLSHITDAVYVGFIKVKTSPGGRNIVLMLTPKGERFLASHDVDVQKSIKKQ